MFEFDEKLGAFICSFKFGATKPSEVEAEAMVFFDPLSTNFSIADLKAVIIGIEALMGKISESFPSSNPTVNNISKAPFATNND